ncbi:uncharacterized protein MYCFIDRAFT_200850 [Pseudocercospora fijiensis CIRAD86]|uniref:Uncharacterized protein n=1 Tax=Pseudocercospora fijiensis (strain CIRAD86) TaxID=383855 RepID=M3AHK9_PSEFD|nr:uncharacterized protein MYCFIDRAFT_200850 [Pseudocercospora fijiensis CIRAD86]EME76997.1 hypothetical protein MYCFIDRAFT_200850 [Pseudocercospora fijiensis CIRAD86]
MADEYGASRASAMNPALIGVEYCTAEGYGVRHACMLIADHFEHLRCAIDAKQQPPWRSNKPVAKPQIRKKLLYDCAGMLKADVSILERLLSRSDSCTFITEFVDGRPESEFLVILMFPELKDGASNVEVWPMDIVFVFARFWFL